MTRRHERNSLKRETIIITGANRGIGRGIARRLAADGRRLILACRDTEDAERTARLLALESGNEDIRVARLDLASLESVRTFAEAMRRDGVELAALVNNAGTLSSSFRRTADGYELTMQVNYLGPFLLTMLLVPLMTEGGARVVNTSSSVYRLGRVDGSTLSRVGAASYGKFRAYADSKLAVLLFTLEAAERLRARGVAVNALDPGIVDTNILTMGAWFDPLTDLLFRPFVRTEDKGAETSAFLATTAAPVTGAYFVDKRERALPRSVRNHPYRTRLWEETARALGLEA